MLVLAAELESIVIRRLSRTLLTPSIGIRSAALTMAAVQVGLVALGAALFNPSILVAGLVLVLFSAAGWCVLLLAAAGAARNSRKTATRLSGMHEEDDRPTILDATTGGYVGWPVRHRIAEEIARSSRFGRPFALVFVHPEPGRISANAGQILSSLSGTFRESDLVIQLRKLRFIVVLAGSDRNSAKLAVERLLIRLPLQDVRVGLACYPEDGDTWEALLTAAGATQDDLDSAAQDRSRDIAA